MLDQRRDLLYGRVAWQGAGAWPSGKVTLSWHRQREVQDRLAMLLLSGEVAEGDHVIIDAQGDDLAFRVERP